MTTPLVSARGLTVRLGEDGPALVDDLELELAPGGSLALVGPSGAGKSTIAHALLGLLPHPLRVTGSIRIDGVEVVGADPARLRNLRGRRIGLVSQEPLAALDPVRTIGGQLVECLRAHHALSAAQARERAVAALDELGVADPRARLRSYAFELSGGERQRVLVALALAGDPAVLVADEPSSALDPPRRDDLARLLVDARRRRGLALLLVSHDLHLVRALADEVVVVDGGRAVERGPASLVLASPTSAAAARLVAAARRRERVS